MKVSDFGMSSLLGQATALPSAYYYGGTEAGAGQKELPVRWMAAEALERNKWSEKTDVYAFGVLMWEVLSGGSVPWGLGPTNREIQDQVLRGELLPCPPSWPRGLVDMIGRCCSLIPANRPTFREILQQLTTTIDTLPAAPATADKVSSGGGSTNETQTEAPMAADEFSAQDGDGSTFDTQTETPGAADNKGIIVHKFNMMKVFIEMLTKLFNYIEKESTKLWRVLTKPLRLL